MTYGSYYGCLSNNAFEYATQRKAKALSHLIGLVHQPVADVDQLFAL